MTTIVTYRTVGDKPHTTTSDTFLRRMQAGLFGSDEIVSYRIIKRNNFHSPTLDEKREQENPGYAENMPRD